MQKSYRHCPAWLRETVGRMAIQRECWALKKLRGSGHAPVLIERPDRFTMLSEYVEGTPLEHLKRVDPGAMKQQVGSLLSALERAGVAHGDLGHDHWQEMGRESNLIWTTDQRLVAIDFAGAIPVPWRPLPRLSLASQLHDSLLRTKLAHHFYPEDMELSDEVAWPVELWDLLRLLGKI